MYGHSDNPADSTGERSPSTNSRGVWNQLSGTPVRPNQRGVVQKGTDTTILTLAKGRTGQW